MYSRYTMIIYIWWMSRIPTCPPSWYHIYVGMYMLCSSIVDVKIISGNSDLRMHVMIDQITTSMWDSWIYCMITKFCIVWNILFKYSLTYNMIKPINLCIQMPILLHKLWWLRAWSRKDCCDILSAVKIASGRNLFAQ